MQNTMNEAVIGTMMLDQIWEEKGMRVTINKTEFKGIYQGKRIYKFHVIGRVEALIGSRIVNRVVYNSHVVSHNPMDALYYAKIELLKSGISYPFEVKTRGVKGREYMRYAGWFTLMGYGIESKVYSSQLNLF